MEFVLPGDPCTEQQPPEWQHWSSDKSGELAGVTRRLGSFWRCIQLSNEKKHPGWLGYIGDRTIQLCRDYFRNHEIRIPINQPVQWKVGVFFFVAQLDINQRKFSGKLPIYELLGSLTGIVYVRHENVVHRFRFSVLAHVLLEIYLNNMHEVKDDEGKINCIYKN